MTHKTIECANPSFFLASSSHKQWVLFNLHSCYIQDRCFHVIHKYLSNSDITINTLWFGNIGITRSSSSFLRDIVLQCKIEVLAIRDNKKVGESRELYTMLTDPSSMQTKLHMDGVSLSSTAASVLFTAMKNNNKLKELFIDHNNITDDAAEAITTSLATKKSLVVLFMHVNHNISGEAMISILQALIDNNNTLQELLVPDCSSTITKHKDRIRPIKQEINAKRISQGIKEEIDII